MLTCDLVEESNMSQPADGKYSLRQVCWKSSSHSHLFFTTYLGSSACMAECY